MRDERPAARAEDLRARGVMSGMLWTGILLSESICLCCAGSEHARGSIEGHTKDKRAKLHVVQGALTAFVCRTTFIVPTCRSSTAELAL